MAEFILLLGGNQGNGEELSNHVCDRVEIGVGKIGKRSQLYRSQSWGFDSEPFWNQVIVVYSDLDPLAVLEQTQKMEYDLGRRRTGTGQYESRIVDIDLLYIDDQVIRLPQLVIPHPRIAERRFALVPLNEVAPDKVDPISGDTIVQLLDKCTDSSWIEPVE